MAALPDPPLVALEEYLNSSYSPDREYVDGVLLERNVGSLPHGLLQKLLLLHFAPFEREMKFLAIPECRTKVEASRYRVPDVLLAPEPVNRKARFYGGVPLAVIEILSPEDRMKVTLERFRDYQTLCTSSRWTPRMQ
jgi:Uma2 family endonuclease